MTRYLSTSMQAASEAPLVMFRMLTQVDARSSTLYMTTGNQYLTVGANTYTPVGALGGVEPIREESDVFPRTVRMWLTAIGTTALAEPLSEGLFNKAVRLYQTYVDATTQMSVVSTPELMFAGRINKGMLHMGDTERGNFYEIEVESRLRKQASASFLTRETHWVVMGYSGDIFFDYLSEVSRRKVKWGTREVVIGGRNDGGPPPGRPPPRERPD